MLKVFRDNLKYLSWVLWAVIAVFVLFVFADFGGIQLGATGQANQVAVTVGDRSVSFGEFERAYRQQESALREQFGGSFSPEMARQLGLPQQVLEQLVQQKILLQEAEVVGIRVTDGEVQRAILELPVFRDANGNFVGEQAYLTSCAPTASPSRASRPTCETSCCSRSSTA